MRALKIAYDDFVKSGKDVREFTITISEKTEENKNGSNEFFSMMFMGKLSPGKRGLGTSNRIPGSVTYFISKDNGKLLKSNGLDRCHAVSAAWSDAICTGQTLLAIKYLLFTNAFYE